MIWQEAIGFSRFSKHSTLCTVLCYFRDADGFATFRNEELKTYPRFLDVLHAFCTFYNLEAYSLKQIDQYIWQLGKEYFPKNYYTGKSKPE